MHQKQNRINANLNKKRKNNTHTLTKTQQTQTYTRVLHRPIATKGERQPYLKKKAFKNKQTLKKH